MTEVNIPVEDDFAKEVRRRAALTHEEEVIKEMRAELEEFRRHEEEEEKREAQVKKPWLYETESPITCPPYINYRRLILEDQERIDRRLEDLSIHFTQMCEKYRHYDTWLYFMKKAEGGGWTKAIDALSIKVRQYKDQLRRA